TVPGPPATTVPGGPGATPGGGLPFGVFNTPKVKPSSSNPVVGLNPKALPGGGVPTATTVDPGFSPVLPYGPTTPTTATPTVAAPVVPVAKGKSSVKSIALVGAGLLVTVVAMHGLWLRSEVKRTGALEVLEPEI
ncbi:MAG: hypothetical protein M3N98_10680, partial [Actinomycetota bacterium]|nr:hypothetical protein [Actinomycetota bacterium]